MRVSLISSLGQGGGKGLGTWVQIHTLPLASSVTQDKLLNLSELWFPLLQNVDNCSLFLWAIVRVQKMRYVKYLAVPGHKVSSQ